MISTYSELQTAIANWLGRTDLTAVIPDFIRLGEAELGRRIRRRTVVGTLGISAESTALPVDCGELRTVRLSTGSPYLDQPLQTGTPVQAADIRARHAGVAGRPVFYWVADSRIRVVPTPDASYTAEITYFEKLVPLSSTAPTNSLLTNAPDAYLFAALMQAEPYLENDARVETWAAGLERVIDQIHQKRDREEFGEALVPVRLPRVF